jgi:adenylosuccinate lyase
MIERYSLPEMAALWSERHKVDTWQEVETLVVEALAEAGVATAEGAAAVRAAPPVDLDAWKAREAETDHDLAAFVDVLIDSSGAGSRWIHHGLTSSDVLDTALGVVLKEAGGMLLGRIETLFEVVRRRALEHRDTVMTGRTHGIWAEPTTFGLKLAGWAFELQRGHVRLRRALAEVSVGKISGAVGTYAHIAPTVEAEVCERLGLGVEPASTQVTARDRHAGFLATLATIGASLERFATEIRHLARSEVAEVRAPFRTGQKGSSAMPHKRNPIAAETITGIARLLRGYAVAGLENVALWHERDISHSSVERVVLPDACQALDWALARITGLIDGLVVDTEQMTANLTATRGLVYSQAVLLALVDAGLDRETSYRIVQRNAMAAWDEDRDLQDLLAADPEVPLDPERLARCFDPAAYTRAAAVVFERLQAADLG